MGRAIRKPVSGHTIYTYKDSEGPGQSVHSLSLIRACAVRNPNRWTLQNVSMESICRDASRKHIYNFDPLKPQFYIVKLGFTGVYIIFLISAQNIDCGYSLEPPRQGGSNEYPQFMFWAEIRKNIWIFYLKICQFLVVKCSICLNRPVFVMETFGMCELIWICSFCACSKNLFAWCGPSDVFSPFKYYTLSPLYTDSQYEEKLFIMIVWLARNLRSRDDS